MRRGRRRRWSRSAPSAPSPREPRRLARRPQANRRRGGDSAAPPWPPPPVRENANLGQEKDGRRPGRDSRKDKRTFPIAPRRSRPARLAAAAAAPRGARPRQASARCARITDPGRLRPGLSGPAGQRRDPGRSPTQGTHAVGAKSAPNSASSWSAGTHSIGAKDGLSVLSMGRITLGRQTAPPLGARGGLSVPFLTRGRPLVTPQLLMYGPKKL